MSKPWFLGILAVAILPWTGVAQNGFKVSPETGLESGTAGEDAAKPKKAKAAGDADAGPKKPTEITASKETTFNEQTRIAVFTGDVKVNDPQFNLTADKLTAYLKKPAPEPDKKTARKNKEAAAAAAAAGASPIPVKDPKAASPAKADANNGPGSGLERAVAEGNVIITQDKVDENGQVTHYIGKGAKADYNATTGDMVLTGWPQIQQGVNNQVATEEGTVMIMNRNGQLKTYGASKTVIQDQSEMNPKSSATTT